MNQKWENRLKRLDVFLIRFLPLVLFIFLGDILIDSWHGISQYPFNLFHSNSVLYAFVLFFVSLADKKYHCVWNRAMYVELIIFPLINYTDAKIGIFPDTESLLVALTITWFAAVLATVILAVRHFVRPRIKKYRKRRDGHAR